MPTLTVIRLTAIAIVVVSSCATRGSASWTSLVASVGFGHYFMALLYSRGRIAEVMRRPRCWPPLLGLLALGALLYLSGFPLFLYFALHHALNEVYAPDQTSRPRDDRHLQHVRRCGLGLHLLLYFFVLRAYYGISLGRSPLAFVGLAAALLVSYAAFFYFLYRLRASLTAAQLVDNCFLEIVALALVVMSFSTRLQFLHVVFYHFAFWFLLPVPGIWARGRREVARYVGLTAGGTGLFLALSPAGGQDIPWVSGMFWEQFTFWSFVHITLSLAFSSANPPWLKWLFGPEPDRASAPARALRTSGA